MRYLEGFVALMVFGMSLAWAQPGATPPLPIDCRIHLQVRYPLENKGDGVKIGVGSQPLESVIIPASIEGKVKPLTLALADIFRQRVSPDNVDFNLRALVVSDEDQHSILAWDRSALSNNLFSVRLRGANPGKYLSSVVDFVVSIVKTGPAGVRTINVYVDARVPITLENSRAPEALIVNEVLDYLEKLYGPNNSKISLEINGQKIKPI